MTDDPFHELGLDRTATPDEVRAARRTLAKAHHPDTGGDATRMRDVNEAAAAALRALAVEEPPPAAGTAATEPTEPTEPTQGVRRDAPSFTVEALPVEAFEALLVVTSWMGEVLDDDPPYRLDTHLYEPVGCWCRLELVPEAGASTVSITVATSDGSAPPDVELVRDIWVDQLNRFDWAEL